MLLSPFPRVDPVQDCVQVCSKAGSSLQLRSAAEQAPPSELWLQLSPVQVCISSEEEGLTYSRRGRRARRRVLRQRGRGEARSQQVPHPQGQRSQVLAPSLSYYLVFYVLFSFSLNRSIANTTIRLRTLCFLSFVLLSPTQYIQTEATPPVRR